MNPKLLLLLGFLLLGCGGYDTNPEMFRRVQNVQYVKDLRPKNGPICHAFTRLGDSRGTTDAILPCAAIEGEAIQIVPQGSSKPCATQD